ncbi:putative esterase [marine actinobacterium PHSC20C1]|nr:putative esterase [marine actinobacterium PHSC20C1]
MHVILIPGFWLTADSWGPVTAAIRAAGHTPHPLTLPGLHRHDAHRVDVTLADHVADVVKVVDSLASNSDGASTKIVIVAHSGGGPIAHAVADARPSALARIIYVDTVPLPPGMPINDELPVVDGEIPLPEWSVFGDEDLVDLTDDVREHFRKIAIPQPARVASDPQELSNPERFGVPATVICCEFPSSQLQEWMVAGAPFATELAQLEDLELVDLPTGHWPQFTKPLELSTAIITALHRS